MLSTYPPTQCGLATFSAALVQHLSSTAAVDVIRVMDDGAVEETTVLSTESPAVVAILDNARPASILAAAAALNSYDVAVIQHEYGIYGGPDGIDVLALLDAVTVPRIVVLHTVLSDPSPNQRHILERLLAGAAAVVTMTETAHARLLTSYGTAPGVVVVIPHGAIDHRVARLAVAPVRPLILTWGLLGPGKGIEWAIDAMVGLRSLRPRYLVLGRTHPKVAQRTGEQYRDDLLARIVARGVEDIVELDNSYLGVGELAELVASATVVLLPYDSADQVTSGVLIEAVAAGRPVVSTAFPHAVELLADGPGLVVPQGDVEALEVALRRVLTEPGLAISMAAHAARKAPDLFWASVADRYQKLADRLIAAALAAAS